ncbi:GNAT family N-acetyltransferase [Silvimonas iriomotensis]|uniref:N-acetyltransferase domain-containing protein n=1 Tax=Silvimonas iriomotensis TaxID=449662 RepID=A0ABQ2PC62_9NEIS|nr:GNAT family N-acetyltransferase [Silvimonas iriomotensis]GGP22840.1 hypothetical protein GCM10010970_28400 [Silvimonas iriomotensis]
MPAAAGIAIALLEHTRPTAAAQIAQVMQQAAPDAPWLPEAAAITVDPARYLGAWRGEALVGVVALSILQESWQLVSSLAVVPAAQRQGIGRTLLDAALGLAGHQTVLLVAQAANVQALALYQQAGFSEHGRFVDEHRGEAMIRLWRPAPDQSI